MSIVEFGRGESLPEIHEAARLDLVRLYDQLDGMLGTSQFLCGEYSIADVAVMPHLMTASFFGFTLDPQRHTGLGRWFDRVQQRPALVRDNADVTETLQCLQGSGQQAFDPFGVQWRSDRLEWVIKNGFMPWFLEELRSGRAFFPLAIEGAPSD